MVLDSKPTPHFASRRSAAEAVGSEAFVLLDLYLALVAGGGGVRCRGGGGLPSWPSCDKEASHLRQADRLPLKALGLGREAVACHA